MTLSHPTITQAEISRLGQPLSATVIDMGGRQGGRGTPYRLVWLRHPDGTQRLYRLIPDPPPDTSHQTPAPDTTP